MARSRRCLRRRRRPGEAATRCAWSTAGSSRSDRPDQVPRQELGRYFGSRSVPSAGAPQRQPNSPLSMFDATFAGVFALASGVSVTNFPLTLALMPWTVALTLPSALVSRPATYFVLALASHCQLLTPGGLPPD